MKVISAKYRLFPISFSLLHIFAKTNGMIINKITRGANAENDGPAVITIENVNNKYKPKDMKKYSNLPVVLLKEKKLGSFLPIIMPINNKITLIAKGTKKGSMASSGYFPSAS